MPGFWWRDWIAKEPCLEPLFPESSDPSGENLAALFARQAARRPDAVAVIGNNRTTTYAELARRMDQFGGFLAQYGIKPEQPVGVLMHRTSDLIAALLAVLKAGGAFVALDHEDPPERTRLMLEGAQCNMVLGDGPLLAWLRDTPGTDPTIALIDIAEACRVPRSGASVACAPCAPGGERLAYILFTSGSTGGPKGVEVEHRNVASLLLGARELLGFTEFDRYLAVSTVVFDAAIAELFLPLVTGGAVVLRDRKLVLDPPRLADDIQSTGVTVFATAPSVWSVILARVPDFPRVRVAITHGEAVAPELAERLLARGDQTWNLYGPTETTVWATGHLLTGATHSGEVRSTMSAPIGRQLPHVTVTIVDERGNAVPDGVQGELRIGGPGLARGYCRNQPPSERFSVYGPERRRCYRTGDVVARDRTGTLHYFGRNDDQIKIRGVRIEPMEVESAILLHPEVFQAAATWFVTPAGSRAIVAAMVLKPGTATPPDLRTWLATRLPPPMIPTRFLFLDGLPLLSSGKVDRNAIRAHAMEARDPLSAPRNLRALTETERKLAAIWQRTLHLEGVALDDHYFSIGGDSLAAVDMVMEVETVFGARIPTHDVYQHPTLEELADHIDRRGIQPAGHTTSSYVFPLVPNGRGAPLFFSGVDQKLARDGLWSAGCPLYVIARWNEQEGFVPADTLEQLAGTLIEHIRRIQPKGPYRVAGYSFGGLIAFEIAHQLRRASEEIELLFLLDPARPAGHRRARDESLRSDEGYVDEPWADQIRRKYRMAVGSKGGLVPYLWGRAFQTLTFKRGPGKTMREWIAYRFLGMHGSRPQRISRILRPRDALMYTAKRLAKRYHARRFDGRTLAVFTDRDRSGVWRNLLGVDANISGIDAAHTELFSEPAMAAWMTRVRECLEQGRAAGGVAFGGGRPP
ncbi:MAG: amino acid adenylation domain-containing protein [Gemmatimonadales bacterium]